jgi:hypothetical protein
LVVSGRRVLKRKRYAPGRGKCCAMCFNGNDVSALPHNNRPNDGRMERPAQFLHPV